MKLRIELPDDREGDDWLCYRELPLAHRHPDTAELLEAYDQSVVLPDGDALRVSSQYGKHNGRVWIMLEEGGKHKASIETHSNATPPRLIFTTSRGTTVRLSVVE